MKMTPGTALTAEDKAEVLRAYVHRYTKDHKPGWAKELRKDGTPFPVQFESDSEWLANSLFATRKDGRLNQRTKHCHSNPTWPDNPELSRRP